MPTHRSLNFETFVSAISPDLLERYLGHFAWESKPQGWPILNADALQEFLDRPKNAEFRGVALEEFRCINDICARGMNLVVMAYRRFGLELLEDRSAQELSMRLFLDAREAFEYAWSRYLLFGGAPKLSVYTLDAGGLEISADHVKRFAEDLRDWFAGDAKGECRVKQFDDAGETVILISRGSYMRTVACWKDDEIAFTTFRPASEDVLIYDHETSQLTMKAGLAKDRERYLSAFATHLAGDPGLAERAAKGHVFSLAPIQDESFDYGGNGVIASIDLLKVRLKLDGSEEPEIEIKSDDVRRTVDRYLKGSLASGQLTYAKFRFHLRPPGGRPTRVTFEIEPPSRTDLAQKRYADIIERYLHEQRVKLT